MCGICGFINKANSRDHEGFSNNINRMINSIRNRGTNQQGSWHDLDKGVCMGHARLAIIDLSEQGAQPMISCSGRYIIVYNGEIYNFLEIRSNLLQLGYKFRGHSDTEVLLSAIEEWGIEKSIAKMEGMFAFALWDKEKEVLYLCRDRMGEKPLYYGWQNSVFFFASELKAIKANSNFRQTISQETISLYLKYNYIPSPYSIYDGIFKLPPGCILEVFNNNSKIKSYWDLSTIMESRVLNKTDENELIIQLEDMLKSVVKKQMISDVPLGAFLSGGMDSSLVVALMQAQSNNPIKTFTIGFAEKDYNEAMYAKKIADYLNTDHTELYVSPQDALNVIPSISYIYDEPFADSSLIPTFLVAKLAKTKVTVSLSGDGGDELFGGYSRYFWINDLNNKIFKKPYWLRSIMGRALCQIPIEAWDKYILKNITFLTKYQSQLSGDRVNKIAKLLNSKNKEDLYLNFISNWNNTRDVLKSAKLHDEVKNKSQKIRTSSFFEWMMCLDMQSYLPDDILTKVDRACMAVSLESRIPLLNHKVVEFALQLPLCMKVRNGEGKWILRQILFKHVPKQLIDRPKRGFGVPISEWLRGPLKDWAEDLLNEDTLKKQDIFNIECINQIWQEHKAEKRNWHNKLWNILMFQSWLESNKNGSFENAKD